MRRSQSSMSRRGPHESRLHRDNRYRYHLDGSRTLFSLPRSGPLGHLGTSMSTSVKKAAVAVGVTAGALAAVCGAPLWATISAGVAGTLATLKLIDKTA
jgi:hypothetical protein